MENLSDLFPSLSRSSDGGLLPRRHLFLIAAASMRPPPLFERVLAAQRRLYGPVSGTRGYAGSLAQVRIAQKNFGEAEQLIGRGPRRTSRVVEALRT